MFSKMDIVKAGLLKHSILVITYVLYFKIPVNPKYRQPFNGAIIWPTLYLKTIVWVLSNII